MDFGILTDYLNNNY